MTIGDDDKLDNEFDDAFGDFLKKHRPQSPSVSKDGKSEEERIWRAIASRGARAGIRTTGKGFAGAAIVMTVMAVLVVMSTTFMNGVNGWLDLEKPFAKRMDAAEDTNLDAVEQALNLRFLENGEINEVTELAAIGE